MTLTLVNWNVGWAETKKRRPEFASELSLMHLSYLSHRGTL